MSVSVSLCICVSVCMCVTVFVSLSVSMLVGKYQNMVAEVEIENVALVESFVYLGVNIDRKLNFEKFVNNTISKVNGRLITLARIRKLVDDKTCLLIYKQTILPIIDYVSIATAKNCQITAFAE